VLFPSCDEHKDILNLHKSKMLGGSFFWIVSSLLYSSESLSPSRFIVMEQLFHSNGTVVSLGWNSRSITMEQESIPIFIEVSLMKPRSGDQRYTCATPPGVETVW